MNEVRDLAVNLIATVLAFFLGTLARSAIHFLRVRRSRHFWGHAYSRSNPVILMGNFDEHKDEEPSGLIGVGDTHAVQELTSMLANLGVKVELSYSAKFRDEEHDKNLILIGAGGVNSITKWITEEKILSNYEFHEGEAGSLVAKNASTGKEFLPDWVEPASRDRGLKTDYGVLIRCANPLNSRRTIIILSGTYGFGTWGAVKLINSEAFNHAYRKIIREHSTTNFECFFRVRVHNDQPLESEILEIRPLTGRPPPP